MAPPNVQIKWTPQVGLVKAAKTRLQEMLKFCGFALIPKDML